MPYGGVRFLGTHCIGTTPGATAASPLEMAASQDCSLGICLLPDCSDGQYQPAIHPSLLQPGMTQQPKG